MSRDGAGSLSLMPLLKAKENFGLLRGLFRAVLRRENYYFTTPDVKLTLII